MNSLGALDTMDPNIPSRQPTSKLQDAQQQTSRATLPLNRKTSETSTPETASSAATGLSHVTRPSLIGVPSFQRPRKRVIWRNKACFIALPPEDDLGRTTNRESYLSSDDCERRLSDWKVHGFDTNGFTLAPQTSDSHSPALQGQSRAVYPDLDDEKRERADGRYRVKIPDQRRWESYVHHLKEDKLRALGVDEQILKSSPTLSGMSRQGSSQSSAVLTSPALASSPHVGPFPSSFYGATNPPSCMAKPVVSHFPTYSMAQAFNEPSPPSPSQFLRISEPQIPGTSSPQIYLSSKRGSRAASPQVNGHLQTFEQAAPSVSPRRISSINHIKNQTSVDLLATTREQQALARIQQLEQQHQQYHHQQPIVQQRLLPSVNIAQNGERILQPFAPNIQAEIVTPIPRDYRQNPSRILQKGADEAEACVSYSRGGNEGHECSKVTQLDHGYDEQQAEDISGNGVKLDTEHAGADGAGSSQHAGEIADPEIYISGQSESRYSSRASHFNVNAPKFEPRKSRSSGLYPSLGNEQAHKGTKSASLSLSNHNLALQAPIRASQPSKLNVAAPAFMPKSQVKATFPSREFSFSASRPSLRPDAPAFEPSDSQITSGHELISEQKSVQPAAKIFGNINFTEVMKLPKSKAVPIVKPHRNLQSNFSCDANMDGQEDESGRITQADGRQKRMRRERDDGDQIPLFASPGANPPWVDRGSEERAAYFSRTQSPESDAVDATTLDAATDLLVELIDDLSSTEASDIMREEESIHKDGKTAKQFDFDDQGQAASFSTARPPDPHEVARATRDFLSRSSQFATALNQASRDRTPSSSGSSHSSTKDGRKRSLHKCQRESEGSIDHMNYPGQSTHRNLINDVKYVEPSYNELDAIMKHLNRENSDFGVHRQPSPCESRSPTTTPIQSPDLKLHDSSTPRQLLPSLKTRIDTPSTSPNRLQQGNRCPATTTSENVYPSVADTITRSARYSPSCSPSKVSPPVKQVSNPRSTPPSDWDKAILSLEDDNSLLKTTLINNMNEMAEGVVQRQLKSLEQVLSGIQQSLTQLFDRSASRRSRSSGVPEIEHSDADDEDDANQVSQSSLKSHPRDRKLELLKASINKITTAQRSFAPASQLVEMEAAVKDLKVTIEKNTASPLLSGDLKSIVEEAVGRQMRGRSAPVTSSSQAAAAERSQLQITGLESMLKIADARANDELQARRSVENELADKSRSLRLALQEASEQRESAEATERSLRDFHIERQQNLQRTAMLESSQENTRKTASDLSEKNSALEETLAEYRLSSDQWRSELNDVKHENKDLKRIITSLNSEVEANIQGRKALQGKVDHLQGDIAAASRDVASDHMRWLGKEEEYKARLEILSARMEAEAATRERLKLEVEKIEAQEMETIKTRSLAEQLQKANIHLESHAAELRSKCHDHQGVIARLRQQIDLVTTDADRSRSRFEVLLEEASDSRSAALGEATRYHERDVKELKAQHQRLQDNALEDTKRSETHLQNQLSLADEKIVHYQDKVSHLEEKLEIARSAAFAAVQAAQSKKAVLSPSSPGTSLPRTEDPTRGTLPEKISPQALRESILVLQEQLQERETRIEQLEYRLSSADMGAPEKLKDAAVEINWLRELLEIRIEDLDDLIATVSQPFYNPESVRDAAIRLKANLQMEQQENGRAPASFPSLASISNIAASPKAIPLAAAAAWDNWRKGRDLIFANQTPSKSSPESFFAGLMTPPSTEMRTTSLSGDLDVYHPSSKRLGRAPMKSKQSLPGQEERERPLRCQPQQDPVTPPLMRKGSYDLDASEGTTFDGEAIESTKRVRGESSFNNNLGDTVGRM